MKTAKTKKSEESAEQKIIEAARKLFTEKSFDAVKTRDIANEAGINLALLNYYFRSKEKLFEIVMQENMQKFFQSIVGIINDEETTIREKVELLVNRYIDMLLNAFGKPLSDIVVTADWYVACPLTVNWGKYPFAAFDTLYSFDCSINPRCLISGYCCLALA